MDPVIDSRYSSQPRDEILLYPGDGGAQESYPAVNDPQAFKHYFDREGFILVRQAVPAALCESAKQAFMQEVLPDNRTFFERHEQGSERHVFTESGFMKYPIMNIQDISAKKFPDFRRLGLNVLTSPTIQQAIQAIFGEPGQMVHTMYFDGNQVTWAHRDSPYLGNEVATRRVIGIWVAVEDIHPEAGRFYVVPRSHQMAVPDEHTDPNTRTYKRIMAEFVRKGPLDCVAPVLKQGDLLLWTSHTIHGSLLTTDPGFSRRSFTAHYIPVSDYPAWRQQAGHPTSVLSVNGVLVTLHGNQHTLIRHLKCLTKNAVKKKLPRIARFVKSLRSTQSPR